MGQKKLTRDDTLSINQTDGGTIMKIINPIDAKV